jgi:protein TonB
VKAQHLITTRHSVALTAFSITPKRISTNLEAFQATPAPDLSIPGFSSGGTATPDSLLPGLIGAARPEPAAWDRPAKTNAGNRPLKVAAGVSEANLTHKVVPVYPPLAKSAGVQGTVEFTATISKEGRIENLRLVRGHPLLVEAARQAVLQWRYRPTLLNGQPVEVVTDIIVNFTLSR